jgi:hypothetical protein
MTEEDPSWTGQWTASRIRERKEVASVQLLHPQVLQITRKDEGPFNAATLASTAVDRPTVEGLSILGYKIDIYINVPKEAMWTGEAIAAVAEKAAAFGGMSDLQRVITDSVPSRYVNPEFEFVERGLRQHTSVVGLRRLHDRKYTIQRVRYTDITVVLLNEYEISADHVRTARDRYGTFNGILKTNPNGRITGAAIAAADSMGATIYMWGTFLSRLNRR